MAAVKPRILIVDDDQKNVVLLTVKMEKEGYEVDAASNGVEALEKVESFHPDLLLLDVMMPKMDGYEVLRRLKSKEETRYIPVIMLTGLGEIEQKVLGFEVGAEDYILKPFSLREVTARVKALLRMRALQAKLRDTEKVAALGEMVDGIAHEVRNPLATIGGMARRLYEHEVDPAHKKYAETIMKSVERLERMMQRIDEYKSVLTSRLERGDINRAITDAVEAVKDIIGAKEVEVRASLMPEPPPVRFDVGNLKIALFNILQNSVEAIEKKGEIRVETFPSPEEALVIRVTDNGCGISPEDLRKIFNPFQTTKLEGAGLGLTITHRIVHDHGGDIAVDSKKGEGTTVTIKLPLAPPPPPEAASKAV